MRFRSFLLYGEQSLAGQRALVKLFQETLTLEYANHPLARYAVERQRDHHHFTRVGHPCLFEHPYRAPQLPLWEPGTVEWQIIMRCEPSAPRRKRVLRTYVMQGALLFGEATDQGG